MVAIDAKYRFAVVFAEKNSLHSVGSGSLCNRIIMFTLKAKIDLKRSFNNLSNEFKFSYVQDEFVVKKKFFDERWGFIFFREKVVEKELRIRSLSGSVT